MIIGVQYTLKCETTWFERSKINDMPHPMQYALTTRKKYHQEIGSDNSHYDKLTERPLLKKHQNQS